MRTTFLHRSSTLESLLHIIDRKEVKSYLLLDTCSYPHDCSAPYCLDQKQCEEFLPGSHQPGENKSERMIIKTNRIENNI